MELKYSWANGGIPRNARIVIAVDVLRAGTTLVCAVENGARRILVADSVDSARQMAERDEAELMGETKSKRIPGFRFGNSPAEMMQHNVPEHLVFTSSNFPKCLQGVGGDVEVVVGALRNMSATIEHCLRPQQDHGGLVVIALAGDEGVPCDKDLALVLGQWTVFARSRTISAT